MTITVRIQYKGEGARKLAAEEHSTDRDVALRYEEDMNRALSLFQIPVPPDSSRAIWKSGFVLCNYAITRDTPMFDRIYRGAFRAQSVACKATLEGLHISYIHLFENSKPIFLGKQAQQRSLSPTARTQTLRQKSPPPTVHRNKTWTRPLGPERSAPELSDRPRVSDTIHRSYSVEKKVYIKQEQSESTVHTTGTNGSGQVMEETLKKLAGSQTLLALLGQGPTFSGSSSPDVIVKPEAASPNRAEPPRAPRSLLASASSTESVNESSGTRHPLSSSRTLSSYQRDSHRSQHTSQDDDYYTGHSRPLSSNRAYSASHNEIPTSSRGRSLQREPPARFTGHDENHKHSMNGSSHDHHLPSRTWENRYDSTPNSRFSRPTYSSEKLDSTPDWTKGNKRPLSPNQIPGRSASPPHHRRRYSIKGADHPGSVHIDSHPRSSGYAGDSILSQPLRRSPTSIFSTPTAHMAPNSNGPPPEDRNRLVQSLNRDLWDVRRQTTALKAQEETIVADLKRLRTDVPSLPNTVKIVTAPTKVSVSEDQYKILEAEIICTCVHGSRTDGVRW